MDTAAARIITATFLAISANVARLIAANVAADVPAGVNLGVATDAFGQIVLTGTETDIVAALAPHRTGLHRCLPVAGDGTRMEQARTGLALMNA